MSWYSENKDGLILFLLILIILLIVGTILYFLLRPSENVTPTLIPSIVLTPNPTAESPNPLPTKSLNPPTKSPNPPPTKSPNPPLTELPNQPTKSFVPSRTPQRATSTPNPRVTSTPNPRITSRTPQRATSRTPQRATSRTPQRATSTPIPKATSTPIPRATSTPIPRATSTPIPRTTPTPISRTTPTPISNPRATSIPNQTNIPESQISISPFEQEMFTRVNDYRVSQGLSKLLLDARLVKAAQTHNNLMSQQNTMSHQLPGELPLANPGNNDDRYDAVNYDWNFAAENVAAGYQTPSAVMTGWINSPGHKANILTTSARDIGVAYNPNGNYWTQNFGNSYGPNQPI